LLPGHSPLPSPGERPADRRALRVGAAVAVLVLGLTLALGQLLLPRVLFLAPGLLARADSSQGGVAGAASFQGFIYQWTRRSAGPGGYQTPSSLANLRSEVRDFHMNTVVIPVVADMPSRSDSALYWHPTEQQDLDTLPDADYAQAIDDARRAGLVPVLELEVKQQDPYDKPLEDARFVGENWYSQSSQTSISTATGTETVGHLEFGWFDNYTAFAAHFAQLAQAKHLKFFVIGDSLSNLTSDGPNSTAQADPQGLVATKGDGFKAAKCSGRHECEWRHVIHAVRARTYTNYAGHAQTGGGYTGHLLYAASWAPGDAFASSAQGEFELIRWWDAVDAVGIDAYFPLTQASADVQPTVLQAAWHGQGTGISNQGDIFDRIQHVANVTGKPVIFTSAGYESVPGSNTSPGQTAASVYDQNEQLDDMQALLQTFAGAPWWAGVIWSYDQPLTPRSAQADWRYGTQWAGDNLGGSLDTDVKAGGAWLASYYGNVGVPCLCQGG
jgi:hypothetical protein